MLHWNFLSLSILLSLSLFLGGCSSKPDSSAGSHTSALSYAEFLFQEAAPLPPAPSVCDATCVSRRSEFRYVVYVGKQIYCYWDTKKTETKIDFDQLAQQLEKTITTATTESEYYLTLRQWASAFHDGHVNVMLKSDLSGIEIYTSPLRVEILAPATDHEQIIVASLKNPVPGLSVGDEIVTINGAPARDALTEAAAIGSSGSTERMRRYWAGRRLVDVIGAKNGSKPFILGVKPIAGGTVQTVSVFRDIEIDTKPSTAIVSEDTGIANFTARVLSNSIGYFKIDAFSGTQDDYLISEAMDRLAQTEGLLLDLRQNGGGDLSADRIIERLIDNVVTRYKRSERLSDFTLAQRPENYDLTPDASGQFALWHDLTVAPLASARYTKPVVALISPYCFSACDTFAAALRDNGLATFVGESTGGGTGTPLVFDLPVTPFQFRYSVIRGQTPNGGAIEGLGTAPDFVIEPTAIDRADKKDRQLARALEILDAKIAGHSGPIPGPLGIDLSNLSQTEQRLDRSPTRVENDLIVKFGKRVEQ